MIILPNQAGVALGLLAFTVASVVGILSGVTLEIAIFRGSFAFIIFAGFGWLLAYLIHDEEGTANNEVDAAFENDTVEISQEGTATAAKGIKPEPQTDSEKTEDPETQHLKAPDDSDF